MKVKIGPYREWIGPYQIAEKILFWMDSEDDRVHNFGKFLAGGSGKKKSLLYRLCSWIQSKKNRKIEIHIDSYDTWSMDHTLALIILPMLKQLKETQHGAPGDMPEFSQTLYGSSQLSFEFYGEGDSAAWDAGHKRWEEILDKMIWSFEQIVSEGENEPKFSRGDNSEFTKYHQRIDEGLALFGKYYRGLWD